MTLQITKKHPLSFTAAVDSIHDCPQNTSCQALYYITFATEKDLEWPTCLFCKCLVEPETWKFPLAPHPNLLCWPCVVQHAEEPPESREYGTEEYQRKVWLVDVISGRRRGLFRTDLPPKRSWTGPKGASKFDKIKAAVRLEEFAGRFTDLRPAGPNKMKGNCPLHKETTPSFHIWLDKQTWRCFGACAMGGDVIALHQQLKDRGLLK